MAHGDEPATRLLPKAHWLEACASGHRGRAHQAFLLGVGPLEIPGDLSWVAIRPGLSSLSATSQD